MEEKRIKSVAKANGLKSNFVIGQDRYFMTTFGKGATAVPAKDIDVAENSIENYEDTFKVEINQGKKKSDLTLMGRSETCCSIPLKGETNQLHAKEKIEKIYFGKSFQDNIHIQIAYNIMDVQKILCAYISIVVCAINHMNRNIEKGSIEDFVGMFKTYNDYSSSMDIKKGYNKELFKLKAGCKKRQYGSIYFNMPVWQKYQKKDFSSLQEKINQYINENERLKNKNFSDKVLEFLKFKNINSFDDLEKTVDNAEQYESFSKNSKDASYYFGDAFTDESGNFSEEKAYAMIRLIGIFRQNFFHYDLGKVKNNEIYKWNDVILEDEKLKDIEQLLNNTLFKRIKNLNDSFKNNNTVNLSILCDIYGMEDFNTLVKEYYDFAIRKEYKNLGFSVKKIRELILNKKDLIVTSGKAYDSVRAKMNNLIDFVIVRYFKEKSSSLDKFVIRLRSALTEEDKEDCYRDYADQIYRNCKSIIRNQIVDNMNSDAIVKLSKKNLPKISNQEPPELGNFAKAIYCLSLFLDGKEVNMLFSALIHKFENIQSLFRVLDEEALGLDKKLENGFSLFENSGKVAADLRFLQSIARMNKGKKYKNNKNNKKNREDTVKNIQYKDAAALFGVTDITEVKDLFEIIGKNGKKDYSLQNFMINNVINNNRFMYVVRFLSPGSARKIMKNEKIVQYILKKLPQSQIERYCATVEIPFDEENMEKNVKELATLLANVSMENFKDVKQNEKKEKYKSIVSLYLTVVYIVVKTLVRINTSYVIAISILERDLAIFYERKGKNLAKENPLVLTKYFEEHNWLSKSSTKYYKACKTNYFKIDENKDQNEVLKNGVPYKNVFRMYRNQIAHLNVILVFADYAEQICNGKDQTVKSMLDLYHYVLFEEVCNKIDGKNFSEENKDGRNSLKHIFQTENKKYYTMCKDFVHCVNLPFAYNAARYANLSVRELFLRSYEEM